MDERGQTWSGIDEVTAMAAEAIFLQMVSQLGRKGDNAFDNVDEALIGRTEEGDGTFLGSLGMGYLEFPAPAVAGLCSRWLLADLIQRHWLRPADEEKTAGRCDRELQAVSSVQLTPALLRDPQSGGELRLELQQPGRLREKPADQVAAEAAGYIRSYGQTRVNEAMLGKIEQNSLAVWQRQQEQWRAWVDETLFAPDDSLPNTHAVLVTAQAALNGWIGDMRRQLADMEEHLTRHTTELEQAETSLVRAAASLPISRKGRIRDALTRTFRAAQALFEAQIQQAVFRA